MSLVRFLILSFAVLFPTAAFCGPVTVTSMAEWSFAFEDFAIEGAPSATSFFINAPANVQLESLSGGTWSLETPLNSHYEIESGVDYRFVLSDSLTNNTNTPVTSMMSGTVTGPFLENPAAAGEFEDAGFGSGTVITYGSKITTNVSATLVGDSYFARGNVESESLFLNHTDTQGPATTTTAGFMNQLVSDNPGLFETPTGGFYVSLSTNLSATCAVPEPNSLLLMCMVGVLVGGRRWYEKRR